MAHGRRLLVVGDRCKISELECCSSSGRREARLLRAGNLHGPMNATDEDIFLMMFSGQG